MRDDNNTQNIPAVPRGGYQRTLLRLGYSNSLAYFVWLVMEQTLQQGLLQDVVAEQEAVGVHNQRSPRVQVEQTEKGRVGTV